MNFMILQLAFNLLHYSSQAEKCIMCPEWFCRTVIYAAVRRLIARV